MSNQISEAQYNKKTKFIHSNKLAGFLIMAGCRLIKVKKNLKNSFFNYNFFIDFVLCDYTPVIDKLIIYNLK
jgi:hypothetical protein